MTTTAKQPAPRWLLPLVLVAALALPGVFIQLGISGVQDVHHSESLLRPFPGGTRTTGTVIGSQEAEFCKGSCTYRPLIRYQDSAGHEHTFTAAYQQHRPLVGAVVQVSINPADPADAHDLSQDPSLWKVPVATQWFMLVVGVSMYVLELVGLVAYLWHRLRHRAAVPSTTASAV